MFDTISAKSGYKVADVLALHDKDLETLAKSTWHLRTLRAIQQCRTGALGGHIAYCKSCKRIHHHKHSCRNRHCPNCQGHKQLQWQEARAAELLNVPYFHLVFTLPAIVNPLVLSHPALIYRCLFDAAWGTLTRFAKQELKAHMGMIVVLHTWGQNLSLHPHLHCIVPKGGLSKAGYWKKGKGETDFLFSVKAMSVVFRGQFMAALSKALAVPASLRRQCYKNQWVVHAQPPIGKPEQIIEYLARYTYKTAISNGRIKAIDFNKKTVTFSYKDYRHGGVKKRLTLASKEFIRRFQQHILPKGFRRIRHYGILSSSWKKEKLPHLQILLCDKDKEIPPELPNIAATKHNTCVYCGSSEIIVLLTYDNRGPPKDMEARIKRKTHKIKYL
jgi:hypothetical protein